MKAKARRKKERLTKITRHNCGKKEHFQSVCKKPKKNKESIGSDGSGVDQLNFEEFEDNESCKSEVEMFNLREYKDQDDVLTDQDVDSIGDTL